jgi:hypothetical protein
MISPRPRPVATEQVHVRCFLGKEYNISSLYNFQAHAAYIATMEKMHNFIMIHNIAAGLLSTRISIDRSIKGLKERGGGGDEITTYLKTTQRTGKIERKSRNARILTEQTRAYARHLISPFPFIFLRGEFGIDSSERSISLRKQFLIRERERPTSNEVRVPY